MPRPTPTDTPTPTPTTITAKITFRIINDQGNPLNDTLVTSTIQPSGMQTLLQITNATGYAVFENTTAGNYSFKIIKQGYPQTNETFEYNGQPLTLTIPLTANNSNADKLLSSTNQIVIMVVIVVTIVVAVVSCLFIIKCRKSPNIKNLQELKKQMESKKKFS
jgi:hypothetical protein